MDDLIKALRLVDRVSRLNPDAGEIGAGMLASLVADARDIAATTETIGTVFTDAELFRRMCAAATDPAVGPTFADLLERNAPPEGPRTPEEFRTVISNALNLLGPTT